MNTPISPRRSISGSWGSKTIRPLHIFESWLPVVSGYTSRSWEIIAGQIAAASLEPRVLVSSRQQTYGQETLTSCEGLEGRLHAVRPSALESWTRRLRPFQIHRQHLERAIISAVEETGAELIHVHWSSGIGKAAAAAAKRLGLPLVAEIRFDLAGAVMSETVRLPAPPLERALRRYFDGHLDGADAIVAAGDSLAAFLRTERPELASRVFSVPNGVDSQRFQPGPADPDLLARLGLEGKFVVGSTSNMLRYEGLDLLLRSLEVVQRRVPMVHALLIGGGTQFEQLQVQARTTGVPVTFTDKVPADEVPQLLRLFNVFVIPRRDVTITRFAGPIKLVEAMASGLPIVGSRVGDIPTLLADGRGVVVEPDSIQALACTLADVATDAGGRARMGGLARAWTETHLRWSGAADRYRELYEMVLAGASAQPGHAPEV
ncbi:MAG TPA: glycosyltransferase family 4 protein [Paludibaculum sp.]|jgi:glycosyltransferase involved in cell wall biosynthesis